MNKETVTKNMTWRELKNAIEKIPDNFLDLEITAYSETHDDTGFVVVEVEELEEDYYSNVDGDYPTPKSVFDEFDEEEKEGSYLSFEKGCPILKIS